MFPYDFSVQIIMTPTSKYLHHHKTCSKHMHPKRNCCLVNTIHSAHSYITRGKLSVNADSNVSKSCLTFSSRMSRRPIFQLNISLHPCLRRKSCSYLESLFYFSSSIHVDIRLFIWGQVWLQSHSIFRLVLAPLAGTALHVVSRVLVIPCKGHLRSQLC